MNAGNSSAPAGAAQAHPRPLTGLRPLRNVPAMSQTFSRAAGRGLLGLLLLGCLPGVPPAAAAAEKPYVETAPKRGFPRFVRPKERTPEAHWTLVQALDRAGKTKAALRQALALRIWWPNSPEAPQAQLLYARLLEQRQKLPEAFEAYQFLLDHYPGRSDFAETIRRQMHLAKTVMDTKKGRFLFLPGFAAPERAIPLFGQIVTNAPEADLAPEAYYLIGVANELTYEYDLAIEAYFTTLNRFPGTDYAAKAAYALAVCHVKISEDAPNDNRALDLARAACQLYLQRCPDSPRRADIEARLARLRARQAHNAYERAVYYDRILRKPEAARIEYRTFVALYPDAADAPAARLRLQELEPSQENPP